MSLISPLQTQKTISPQMVEAKVNRLRDRLESVGDKSADELKEVSREFESLFIFQMFKAMRKTVPKSELLNSFSMDMYESMLDEQLAKEMSQQKGIGLADILYRQLARLDPSVNENEAEPAQINLNPNPSRIFNLNRTNP